MPSLNKILKATVDNINIVLDAWAKTGVIDEIEKISYNLSSNLVKSTRFDMPKLKIAV